MRQRASNVEMLKNLEETMQDLEDNLCDSGQDKLLHSYQNVKKLLHHILDRTALDEVYAAETMHSLQRKAATLVFAVEDDFTRQRVDELKWQTEIEALEHDLSLQVRLRPVFRLSMLSPALVFFALHLSTSVCLSVCL